MRLYLLATALALISFSLQRELSGWNDESDPVSSTSAVAQGPTFAAPSLVPIINEGAIPSENITPNRFIITLDKRIKLEENLKKHFDFIGQDLAKLPDFAPLKYLPGYHCIFNDSLLDLVRRNVDLVKRVEQDYTVKQAIFQSVEDSLDWHDSNGRKETAPLSLQRTAAESSSHNVFPEEDNTAPHHMAPGGFRNSLKVMTPTRRYNLIMVSQPKGVTLGPDFTQRPYRHLRGAGEGVRAYVLDSGIRLSHHEFGGRATNFRNMEWSPYTQNSMQDLDGHGTHCAGILGGNTVGVAPNVSLVNVKACADRGCNSAWALSALDDVIEEINGSAGNYSVRGSLISISLIFGNHYDSSFADLCSTARQKEIPVISTAGNRYPGDIPWPESPCAFPDTVCVGAVDETYRRFWPTKYGTQVNITAPGVDILSASHYSDDSYVYKSGTSMATPHIGGILAIFMACEGIKSNVSLALERLYENQLFGLAKDFYGRRPPMGLGNTGVNRLSGKPYIGFPGP